MQYIQFYAIIKKKVMGKTVPVAVFSYVRKSRGRKEYGKMGLFF